MIEPPGLHACTRQLLNNLVQAKLASASTNRVGRGGQIEVTRIKITEGGHDALSKLNAPLARKTFGTTASPPRTKQANGKAGVQAERRKLLTDMTLSPPPPGCERRARRIVRKFTLDELLILVEALRDGITDRLHVAFHRAWDPLLTPEWHDAPPPD
jgi:hypothetical protein